MRVIATAADQAFVSGIHLAVTVGAVLALISAVIVFRYLPHSLVPEAALPSVGAAESTAVPGLSGVTPVLATVDDT